MSTQRELFNEYQQDRVWMFFKKDICYCGLDESRLGRVSLRSQNNARLFHDVLLIQLFCKISEKEMVIRWKIIKPPLYVLCVYASFVH